MSRHIRDDRGMTLVELMMVLMVFSLVMGAVFSLFMTSLTAYWKGDLATQVQQSGRIGLDRLTRDLRQARALINAQTWGGFTFNTACTPNPQISFVQPHIGNVQLFITPTSLFISATDANTTTGAMPYDGYYVSYYLSAAQASASGGTTPSAGGPYLNKTVWDIVNASLTTVTIASNVTGLAFPGTCPTTASREFTVQITASQTVTATNVSSKDVVTSDVALRNNY